MKRWEQLLKAAINRELAFPWHCIYIFAPYEESVRQWEEFVLDCRDYGQKILLVRERSRIDIATDFSLWEQGGNRLLRIWFCKHTFDGRPGFELRVESENDEFAYPFLWRFFRRYLSDPD